jgi:hypothetical protein
MVEGRTDRLDELLADNYTAIHIGGYQQDKAEWLDQIDSGRMTYDAVREESSCRSKPHRWVPTRASTSCSTPPSRTPDRTRP